MEVVENYTDAAVAEVHASADAYAQVEQGTAPLKRFLDFWQAIKWLDLTDAEERALQALLDGRFGDPVAVAAGMVPPHRPAGAPETLRLALDDEPEQLALAGTGTVSVREWNTVSVLIERAHSLAAEEHFLHWEVAFPGVWRAWQSAKPDGGFDAIVGNPPWDRMKMQEVEWFAARDPAIARQERAADRKAMVSALIESRSPLGASYLVARARAEKAVERARKGGEYPTLGNGDINIYSLFVERALSLIHSKGFVGLLTPIGIGTDKTAAKFFSQVSEERRVVAFLSFENKGGWLFADVHHEDQPTVFVVGGRDQKFDRFDFAVKLHRLPQSRSDVAQITSEDCRRVNPNTGTVPIFRTSKSAELTEGIYGRLPILVSREIRSFRHGRFAMRACST